MTLRRLIAPCFVLALLAGSQAAAQVNPGTSPLSGAKGGTDNAFMQFAGPVTSLKTFTLPNASDTIATLAAVRTWTGAQSFTDGTLILLGSSSGSSTLKAPATGGGTATLFAGSDTVVGRVSTDTLTNKTLTSPVIATISNGGTLTLPSGPDTLVGRASTDTLINKTLTAPTLSSPVSGGGIFTNPVIAGANPATVGTGGIGFTAGLLNWYDGSSVRSAVAADTTQTLTNKTFNCANNTCTVRIGTDVSGLGTNVATVLGNAANTSGGLISFSGTFGSITGTTVTAALVGNATTATTATNVTTNANLTGDVTSVGNATTYNNTVPANKGGTGVTTAAAEQARLNALTLQTTPITVNFAVAGDNAIAVPMPTGMTQFRGLGLSISGCTASAATATFGLFTDVAGGGAAITASGTAVTVTSGTANTNNNFQNVASTNVNTELYTPVGGNVQFRIGSTAAATCKVTVLYNSYP